MSAKILIVEDDMVVRANLEVILSEMGHEIVGFTDNAVDALVLFTVKSPHVVICDISINGTTNGIELAKKMHEIRKAPVLFLTAYSNEEFFNEAKLATPLAFISKPIEKVSFKRSVALAIEHSKSISGFTTDKAPVEECLYTRVGNRLKKLYIKDIEFVEVDGKYSALSIGQRMINCKISLKDLIDKLPREKFIQVNRNFVINMDMIEDIDMANFNVKMPSKDVPISRTFKDQLMDRIKLI
jgi:DNA-binding LytR/AlgR family response regulator